MCILPKCPFLSLVTIRVHPFLWFIYALSIYQYYLQGVLAPINATAWFRYFYVYFLLMYTTSCVKRASKSFPFKSLQQHCRFELFTRGLKNKYTAEASDTIFLVFWEFMIWNLNFTMNFTYLSHTSSRIELFWYVHCITGPNFIPLFRNLIYRIQHLV